ncbi:MAG: AMP-binding protein [Pseudomonadota bacterium]
MTSDSLFSAVQAAWGALPPDASAITVAGASPQQRYTWCDLEEATAMLANGLAFLDLPAGARVAVQTEKSVETLLLYLAVLRAGLVYVPLNTGYTGEEMRFFLEDARPSVLVCGSAGFGRLAQLAFASGVKHVFTLNPDGSGTLLGRAAVHPRQHTPVPRAFDDLAAILYTSGTTGRSKGAMLSHGNLLSNARALVAHWDWRADDVLLHALPLFHVHGLFVACHTALLGGSQMLWLTQFDPAAAIELLPQATVFMGVPTLYTRLLGHPALGAEACRPMRLFISGSAPLRTDTFEAFRARTGHTILERYGMSETLMISSNPCRPSDGERRAGTVGRALPGVELRIAAAPQAAPSPDGSGEVEVRGPNVCQGYWQRPEPTREAFTADGWFRTGDIGRLDADGVLTLVGRAKDLIISGGLNVYPAEVETAINALPGVVESAVIGVPHPDFGEAVVAVVVPEASGPAPDIAAWTLSLNARLARFKCPKVLLVAAELPRNAMGKVQKNLLREAHRGLFDAPSNAHF